MASYDIGSTFTRKEVQRRVLAAMKAQITIIRGDLGVMDPDTLIVAGLVNVETIYSGVARIKTVRGQGFVPTSMGAVPERIVEISIPIASAVPRVDDCVVVAADDLADSDLDTRLLRVTEVDGGTFFGDARRFTVSSWYESRYWGAQ